MLKSGPARHVKDCGTRDLTKCLHCTFVADSFSKVRQQKRRVQLMAKIAQIEAWSSVSNTVVICLNFKHGLKTVDEKRPMIHVGMHVYAACRL